MENILIIIAIVVVLLLGPNLPEKIYKWYLKIKVKNSKPYNIKLHLLNGNQLLVENIHGTLNESLMNNSLLKNLTSEDVIDKYNSLTEEQLLFIQNSSRKNLAIYAVNTFKAYDCGFMQKLTSNPEMEMPEFKDFVCAFDDRSSWTIDGILDLNSQMKEFFQSVIPEEGEAIVGFTERQVVTSHRFIIFSEGNNSIVEQIIPLAEIVSYNIIVK